MTAPSCDSELDELSGPNERPAGRRWHWAGVFAAVGLLLVLFHLLGLLRGLEAAVLARLPERPSDALLGIVNVFTCCVLSWKALTTMLPAFILGGAIAAFIPTSVILRYLGAEANRITAYGAAALSGCVLSLCSCNIVPLFASIYRRGAGIGPAFAFLYAGPAINPITIIFTLQVIGWHVGLWRGIGVPVVALLVGLLMSLLFGREERARAAEHTAAQQARALEAPEDNRRLVPFFGLLLALVIYGAVEMSWTAKAIGMGVIAVAVVVAAWRWFEGDELRMWGHETWALVRMVIPVLLPAILLIGAIAAYVDIKLVYHWLGAPPEDAGFWRTLRPTLLADVFGALMYFPILSEVPFVKAFLKLGMDIGPALAVLLTGAGLSLPGLFIISHVIGWKKALVYEGLVILLTTAFAFAIDMHFGEYICECMMMGK